jgi:hypothetical protein
MQEYFKSLLSHVFIWLCLLSNENLVAQNELPKAEHLLIETYWHYDYTIHLETGTAVHQADDYYDLYVIFHYDSIFRLYNNGLMIDGKWSMQNGQLKWPFRQVENYRVISVTPEGLELSFTPVNGTGTMLYHFTAEDKPSVMFARREGELPEILIREKKQGLFTKATKRNKRGRNKNQDSAPPTVPIQIEITGGGYYGGVDPVLRDHITIKSNGRLVQEFMTKGRGLMVIKKDIPRAELEAFVAWCEEQKFFDFERQYDCTSTLCDKRKSIKPAPTPLRVCITYGPRRKMVTVAIFGKDKHGERYVDYPPQIDHIVDAVQRMASRI